MRLLFTLGAFPPAKYGGIVASMFSVIDGLNKTSVEIVVLTTNCNLPHNNSIVTNKWIDFEGIKVNYIKAKSGISLKYIFEGFRQIRLADQVHLSGTFYLPSMIFAIFSSLAGKPVFLSPHGDLMKPAIRQKYWKKAPYLILLKLFCRKVVFRPTSVEEASQIQEFFPNAEVHIIPNFFKFDAPFHLNKLNQFVFLGRICSIKKIENLILACSISSLFLTSDYKLLLAGPSDGGFLAYETMLRELIISKNLDRNILFLGEVLSPHKEALLSQSKALFLVSDSENFGNVVVESLAQGTPVVASKGAPWKSLEENNCGYWIDNSPESIADKIDEIISMNASDFKIMSENAIVLSKEFTSEKVLPKWFDLINTH